MHYGQLKVILPSTVCLVANQTIIPPMIDSMFSFI